MDMNVCPICRTPDANGFCACLGVMVKSEDYIDLKNASDPKKRIKEAPGTHEGKLPSDEKIKEVDTGDGVGGEIKKCKIPGRKSGDLNKAGLNPSAPMTPKPPAAPTAPGAPAAGIKMAAPNPMGTPRTSQIKLPGMGMKHAPAVKQQAGGDMISSNPPPSAPGLGSMKTAAPTTFGKSEDFGKCVLCGNSEHIGDCSK